MPPVHREVGPARRRGRGWRAGGAGRGADRPRPHRLPGRRRGGAARRATSAGRSSSPSTARSSSGSSRRPARRRCTRRRSARRRRSSRSARCSPASCGRRSRTSPTAFHVLPNSVPVDLFRRRAAGRSATPDELLFVGYRKASKGIENLLRAVAVARAVAAGDHAAAPRPLAGRGDRGELAGARGVARHRGRRRLRGAGRPARDRRRDGPGIAVRPPEPARDVRRRRGRGARVRDARCRDRLRRRDRDPRRRRRAPRRDRPDRRPGGARRRRSSRRWSGARRSTRTSCGRPSSGGSARRSSRSGCSSSTASWSAAAAGAGRARDPGSPAGPPRRWADRRRRARPGARGPAARPAAGRHDPKRMTLITAREPPRSAAAGRRIASSRSTSNRPGARRPTLPRPLDGRASRAAWPASRATRVGRSSGGSGAWPGFGSGARAGRRRAARSARQAQAGRRAAARRPRPPRRCEGRRGHGSSPAAASVARGPVGRLSSGDPARSPGAAPRRRSARRRPSSRNAPPPRPGPAAPISLRPAACR